MLIIGVIAALFNLIFGTEPARILGWAVVAAIIIDLIMVTVWANIPDHWGLSKFGLMNKIFIVTLVIRKSRNFTILLATGLPILTLLGIV